MTVIDITKLRIMWLLVSVMKQLVIIINEISASCRLSLPSRIDLDFFNVKLS